MKKIFFYSLILIFSYSCLADEINSQNEKDNQAYYRLLSFIENAKNEDLSIYARRENMANIIDQMSPSGPAANWVPIKDGFFDIMIDDPNFFFSEMLTHPDQLDELMKDFSLNWLSAGESNYPEKKQLALKSLKKYIKNEEKKLELSKKFKKIIEKTKPSVVD